MPKAPQNAPHGTYPSDNSHGVRVTEPFDLQAELANLIGWENTDRVMEEVLRSPEFRRHAYSLDHKPDVPWCNRCYDASGCRQGVGCTQDLLTELFGEVEG